MRVFIGSDPRETPAVEVAVNTLRSVSGIEAELLDAERLRSAGLLSRAVDHRGGRDYDLISNESTSTRFKISRFLTPILCQSGWALFTDCDVVFLRDPLEMLKEIKPGHAAYVVKHAYVSKATTKMVDQDQTQYPCKNWSSVVLFDASHRANRRLSLHDINTRPARDLHSFYWLADAEIGSLDPAWNWLVNETPKPENLAIAHFTNGGPWLSGWQAKDNDDLWLSHCNQ